MSHTLYWSSRSGSLAPLCLLIETGTPHDTVEVDTRARAHKSPDYLRDVHPLGTVPALRLPDGMVLIESAAMVLYLADRAPGLAPSREDPARPAHLQWVTYGAATLYSTCLRIYHTEDLVPDAAARDGARAMAVESLDRQWAVVERGLGGDAPYLFGDRAGAADIYLAMLASWHPAPERFEAACPGVARLRRAVWDLPSMRRALAVHRLD